MSLEFRRMQETQSDYQALAAITYAYYKNHNYTAEQTAYEHEKGKSNSPYFCHLAFEGGEAVGTSQGGIFEEVAWLEVLVRPEHQGKGIGSKLLDLVCADLLEHNPERLEVQIREDWTGQETFYARRGFVKGQPWAQWKLELGEFDGSGSSLPSGIQIRTLSEHGEMSELCRTIYDLWSQARQELRRDSKPPYPFEQFQTDLFEAFWFRPEAFWLALEKDQIVGVHWVAAYPDDPTSFLEWVSVVPSHRRRGIARALVVCGLEFAQKQGYSVAEANTNLTDAEINGLLEQMDFVRHPGYVMMVKTLS